MSRTMQQDVPPEIKTFLEQVEHSEFYCAIMEMFGEVKANSCFYDGSFFDVKLEPYCEDDVSKKMFAGHRYELDVSGKKVILVHMAGGSVHALVSGTKLDTLVSKFKDLGYSANSDGQSCDVFCDPKSIVESRKLVKDIESIIRTKELSGEGFYAHLPEHLVEVVKAAVDTEIKGLDIITEQGYVGLTEGAVLRAFNDDGTVYILKVEQDLDTADRGILCSREIHKRAEKDPISQLAAMRTAEHKGDKPVYKAGYYATLFADANGKIKAYTPETLKIIDEVLQPELNNTNPNLSSETIESMFSSLVIKKTLTDIYKELKSSENKEDNEKAAKLERYGYTTKLSAGLLKEWLDHNPGLKEQAGDLGLEDFDEKCEMLAGCQSRKQTLQHNDFKRKNRLLRKVKLPNGTIIPHTVAVDFAYAGFGEIDDVAQIIAGDKKAFSCGLYDTYMDMYFRMADKLGVERSLDNATMRKLVFHQAEIDAKINAAWEAMWNNKSDFESSLDVVNAMQEYQD